MNGLLGFLLGWVTLYFYDVIGFVWVKLVELFDQRKIGWVTRRYGYFCDTSHAICILYTFQRQTGRVNGGDTYK